MCRPKTPAPEPPTYFGYIEVVAKYPGEWQWVAGEQLFVHRIDNEYNLYVKYPELIDEWESGEIDGRVKRVVRHLAVELGHLGKPAVITSLLRDNSGVHAAGRAADVRLSVTPKQGNKIRDDINKWLPYRRLHFRTVPPLNHGTAPHFHLQVRPE